MPERQETVSSRNGESHRDEGDDVAPPWDAKQIRQLMRVAGERVGEQVQAHPFRSLALAFGCGYVLGGGMPRVFMRLAGGTLSTLVLDAVVTELAQRLVGGVSGAEGDAGERRRARVTRVGARREERS